VKTQKTIQIPTGHPTSHDAPHNSEFCSKCVHETYCEACRFAIRNPVEIPVTRDQSSRKSG